MGAACAAARRRGRAPPRSARCDACGRPRGRWRKLAATSRAASAARRQNGDGAQLERRESRRLQQPRANAAAGDPRAADSGRLLAELAAADGVPRLCRGHPQRHLLRLPQRAPEPRRRRRERRPLRRRPRRLPAAGLLRRRRPPPVALRRRELRHPPRRRRPRERAGARRGGGARQSRQAGQGHCPREGRRTNTKARHAETPDAERAGPRVQRDVRPKSPRWRGAPAGDQGQRRRRRGRGLDAAALPLRRAAARLRRDRPARRRGAGEQPR
mmetsp:Transcript_3863/g.12226  ORF Transcript_3863/g.12226 Transcript_3863/m.12226 type:complete len:271 (-) Transcript_3863:1764-2576(-)